MKVKLYPLVAVSEVDEPGTFKTHTVCMYSAHTARLKDFCTSAVGAFDLLAWNTRSSAMLLS